MPSILSDADRETVKRTVPKASNKIHAVAVARLYIAHPNRSRWTYTGLQGAVVLANDLIGNTHWIKLVDVSPANRGVIWDQEIYDPFYYNQDRTFFHSFELEECLAGLSFVDEKEARTFKKKMDEREKNASKATRNTPFQGTKGGALPTAALEKQHSRFSNLIHGRSSSSQPAQQPQTIIPARDNTPTVSTTKTSGISALDEVDPSWRSMLSDLLEMGITEDQIEENADFIKSYIEQRQAEGAAEQPSTVAQGGRANVPPLPPPAPPGGHRGLSPQNTGPSKRGPPPAPPPSRRTRVDQPSQSSSPKQPTPPRSPERTPSPLARPTFKVPPPLADAGKLAHATPLAPSARSRLPVNSSTQNHGPPPPPRPPKTPVEDEGDVKPRFGVPPPFLGERSPPPMPSRAPAPPTRGPVPAPPPRTGAKESVHAVPPTTIAPPPLPPKVPSTSAPIASSPPPPPPPLPPPAPAQRSVPPPPSGPSAPPPPPPPLPSTNQLTSGAPPPPPPLPPGRGSGPTAAPLPTPMGGTDALLASIRGSGGAKGGGLRRVKSSEKMDRSAAMVPGSENTKPSSRGGGGSTGGAPGGGGGGGGLADALASALSARNKKVSASDDESDGDSWDDDAPKKKR